MIEFKITQIRHIIELFLFFSGWLLVDRSESQTGPPRNRVFSGWMGYSPGFIAPYIPTEANRPTTALLALPSASYGKRLHAHAPQPNRGKRSKFSFVTEHTRNEGCLNKRSFSSGRIISLAKN